MQALLQSRIPPSHIGICYNLLLKSIGYAPGLRDLLTTAVNVTKIGRGRTRASVTLVHRCDLNGAVVLLYSPLTLGITQSAERPKP